MGRKIAGLFSALTLFFLTSSAHAAVTAYTDETTYTNALAGYSIFQEGFEDDAAWGSVRSTFSSLNTAPSVTSQGITWTSNHPATNHITTGAGAAVSGSWGIYDPDHGYATGTPTVCDVDNPPPECLFHDGVSGTRVTGGSTVYGVGGWFTGTTGANIVFILIDDQAGQVEIGLGKLTDPASQPNFFGVIDDTNGIASFEVREVDGKVGQEKLIFADDFTFGTAGGGTVCGNGTVEGSEQCDDGNTVNGDCCSSSCQFEPADTPCPDGIFCNGEETCNGSGTCVAGTAVVCDDGVACTDDTCNETTDSCDFVADNTNCPDDGSFCNGQEFCDLQVDCSSTGDPCQAGTSCNETTDTCDPTTTCGNLIIEAGEQCDDGNTVNGDCCSSSCQFEPAGNPCRDGIFCNGEETCNGSGTCVAGTTVVCDDGVACTDDTCNETTDSCDFVANDANCSDDGLFCTGQEFCDLQADCSSTGDPCQTGTACNETTDTCDVTTACGNGIVEGTEQCDDGNTLDGDCCDALCMWEPAGSLCADNQFCNGEETCDGSGTCQPGIPVDCSDGNVCTDDSCDPSSGCVYTNNTALCDDENLCTAGDFCSAGICIPGAVQDCDDGNDCSSDSCDPTSGCKNICSATGKNDPCCSEQVCTDSSACRFNWQMFLPAITTGKIGSNPNP